MNGKRWNEERLLNPRTSCSPQPWAHRNGMGSLQTWTELEQAVPALTDPMRRYLAQLETMLRPGSVTNTDQALRCLATYLVIEHPDVTRLEEVSRVHIEGLKRWLAQRPGRSAATASSATLAHRLGTLRMFFLRIEEWGWEEAPERVPIFLGDIPRQNHPLPKALDDAAAAKLLRAARNDPRLLVRVTVEVLLRTGLRVSEFTGLGADAVVMFGQAPWLHVPVGKLRDDRYLPLHPDLVELIDDYRTHYVPDDHPLLLPRESGQPATRHSVARILDTAAASAGIGHIHPHQMRHTLATQAINRGMSIEAVAAMLGHHSLDMTLRYAKIANRTVADEYFAVTDQVDALYDQAKQLPADVLGPNMTRLGREHDRLLGNGRCTRPAAMDCSFECICESCTFFATSIEFRPVLQAQLQDAQTKGQQHRITTFTHLLHTIDTSEAS